MTVAGAATESPSSKFLLGAFGILTAALTAFGAVSGTIDRIERNHPTLFWSGAVLVLVSVSIGALGLTLTTGARYTVGRKNRLIEMGVGLVVLGVVGSAFGIRFTSHDTVFVITILIFVAIGVALWVRGSFSSRWADTAPISITDRLLYGVGIFAFLIGMALVLWAIIVSATNQGRPAVSASLKATEGGFVFVASVKASGLKADEHAQVLVQGISPPRRREDGRFVLDEHKRLIFDRVPLYSSILGPNGSGEVDNNLEIPLRRTFDSIQIRAWIGGERSPEECFRRRLVRLAKVIKEPGCLTVRAPFQPALPQLAPTWKRSPHGTTLLVHVTAQGLPLNVIDASRLPKSRAAVRPVFLPRPTLIHMRVTSMSRRQRDPVLFSALLAPDFRGAIDQSLEVPVGTKVSVVCVSARAVPPSGLESTLRINQPTGAGCVEPNRRGIVNASTVWALLRVPK